MPRVLVSLATAAVLALGVSTAGAQPPTRTAVPPCVEQLPAGLPLSCREGAPLPSRDDTVAYEGLGTWLDAFDWAPEYGGRVRPAALDAMRDAGIRTVYLQAVKVGSRSGPELLSPELLAQWLVGAHERGMRVQAWYLPLFTDVAADRRALDAIVGYEVEGHRFDTIGLDIEWRGLRDVEERNRRLVALATRLREQVPTTPLAGIVVAPVVTHDVNRQFWDPFPWAELAPLFDVWQPMGYWTDRKRTSRWRDAHESTVWNTRFLREALDDPDAKVHAIGGISPTRSEVQGFVRAAHEERALGGSVYDWPHTDRSLYRDLQGVPGQ